MARASVPAAPAAPLAPSELLTRGFGDSGLAAANILKRAGRRLGWYTVRDLLFHLPRRYDDLREMQPIAELWKAEIGTVVSVRGTVASIRVEPGFRRRTQRTIAVLTDEGGASVEATWFGRRFIERRLKPGDIVVASGRVKRFGRKLTLDNPDFQAETDEADMLHVGRIVPVYRLTAGLTAARLRSAMREALDKAGCDYPEYLAADLRGELPAIGQALEAAHFPETFEGRDAALRRLAFDELLALQLGMVARRRQRGRDEARAIVVDDETDRGLREGLEEALGQRLDREVSLTDDQVTAIAELRGDLALPRPMLRLLQGDVGSGKTAVAAYALGAAAKAGLQAALLAPTDLLARQHWVTLTSLLEPVGVHVELLAGSLSAADKRRVNELVASGMAPVVVGTHALIQESVSFAALGVVVIDEQHRFGVEQRGQLEAKAGGNDPHVLLMTATPIPRTLGQVLYADLDVSTLRTPPAGRLAIRTAIRHPADLERLWTFVRTEAEAGRATFVVVPAIEETEGSDVAAAETEAQRLAEVLAPLRVGMVHGRMRAQDRDAELGRLRDGELDVLVGTTVLEVGVDVSRASVMVILSAELFGLAQLHQLRGRVGRGTDQSYAVLVSGAAASTREWDALREASLPPTTTEQARLVAVARTTDGFELAEKDWELRREGDVLGLAQSGLPQLRVASLQNQEHRALATTARSVAETLLDPAGSLQGNEALRGELHVGWLSRVYAAEPESAA
jgi:ATP-dependent DNA helicase RecG